MPSPTSSTAGLPTAKNTIPYKISFTDDELARKAAAHQLRLIFCHCHRVLDLEDITPLTVKLLWHLTRAAKQTSADILAIPVIQIIYAIKHAPHMVRGKGSLFAILFDAIKVLPIAKTGRRQLRSLVFEPDYPKQPVQRITRYTLI